MKKPSISRELLELLAKLNLEQTPYVLAKQVFVSDMILNEAKRHTNLISFYSVLDDFHREQFSIFLENELHQQNSNPFELEHF